MPQTVKEVTRSPSFVKLYATKVIGGRTKDDIRFEILNEKLKIAEENQERWVYVSDALVMLTENAARELLKILKEALEDNDAEGYRVDNDN